MSGLADTFGRGRTEQSRVGGGPNEPPWCQLSAADACRTAPVTRNDYHYQFVSQSMSRSTLRPVIKLRSTAGTGYTYVTRKSRRNDPDRLVIRKYDPVASRHVEFREER
jgi:large subunit ribosomal protein L33